MASSRPCSRSTRWVRCGCCAGTSPRASAGPGVLHQLTGAIAQQRGDISSVEISSQGATEDLVYFEIDLPGSVDQLVTSLQQLPVVRGVEQASVGAVAGAVRDLVERSRAGRLRQDELEGGSITLTNLGMYGTEEFAAIINPPQAAILAVGAVRDEPVVEDGAVVAGQVMTVTLSVDHRPVDGVLAARWLAVLTGLLENPVRALA